MRRYHVKWGKMKIGNLVKYKDGFQLQTYEKGFGMIIEEDGCKGWEAYVYVMWGHGASWEHVVDLEVVDEKI